jgi:5-formyltetrahydrofolate cyclo-ligase
MNDKVDPGAEPTEQVIKVWRKQTRTQFVDRRLAMDPADRKSQGEAAKRVLLDNIDLSRFSTLGIYWPFRGEIDVRDIACRHINADGKAALPVVVTKNAPVEFWNWRPEMKFARGIWNIPIPPERDEVQPDALIIPVVGFDQAGFRLGYGGGYYDRTIAASSPRPFCIGVGYASFELPTIYPQPFDMRMDVIVTERFFRRTS